MVNSILTLGWNPEAKWNVFESCKEERGRTGRWNAESGENILQEENYTIKDRET